MVLWVLLSAGVRAVAAAAMPTAVEASVAALLKVDVMGCASQRVQPQACSVLGAKGSRCCARLTLCG